jgi:hypothetical protein
MPASAAFFRELNMTRDVPPTADSLDPTALQSDDRAVTNGALTIRDSGFGVKRQKVPHQVHSIWFGGPLYDDGPNGARTDFRQNVVQGARHNRDFDFVLWTDVTRAELDQVRGDRFDLATATERQQQVRSMLDWATGEPNIRLANVDEVFNRDTPMSLQSEVLTERARGGKSYAVASDISRVEILHRFGGVYTDGDNQINELTNMTRQVAQRPDGFALLRADSPPGPADGPRRDTRPVNNAAMAAAARADATQHYLDLLGENYRMPLPQLLRRAFPNLDARGVTDDEIAQDRTPFARLHTPSHEVVHRTGPNRRLFDTLADRLGHTSSAQGSMQVPAGTSGDRFQLGSIPPEAITVRTRDSWNVGFSGGSSAPHTVPRGRLEGQLRQTVVDLHAELRNRPGGLPLRALGQLVNDLPSAYRVPFWTQAIALFHESLGPDTGQVRWIALQDADLPHEAHETIRRLFPDAEFHGAAPRSAVTT